MNNILTLTDFMFDGLAYPLNISLDRGMQIHFIAAGEYDTRSMMQLFTGSKLPEHGKIMLFENDTATFSRQQMLDARKHIGIITHTGNLISNLKLWENITLPTMFRLGMVPEQSVKQALQILDDFGYKGNLMSLPGHLSVFELRMASFIRAAISLPKIMLYAGCFDNLSAEENSLFLQQAIKLQANSPEQVSIYITSGNTALEELKPDLTISLQKDTGRPKRSL